MCTSDAIPTAVGALSAAIAENLSDDDIALLSAIFSQLGDSLAVILAARDCCSSQAKTVEAVPR
jgi:cytochrome c553